jgi:hypothetical protein
MTEENRAELTKAIFTKIEEIKDQLAAYKLEQAQKYAVLELKIADTGQTKEKEVYDKIKEVEDQTEKNAEKISTIYNRGVGVAATISFIITILGLVAAFLAAKP